MRPTLDLEISIGVRTRRMKLACALMRLTGMASRCLPRALLHTFVRMIACRIAVIEIRTGGGRWERLRIRPEEITFA